jgi:hypothetical protein
VAISTLQTRENLKAKNNQIMNTKILTMLTLVAASQFAAIASPAETTSPEFPVPLQGNPFAMTRPFIVTAPRITPRDLQLSVTAGLTVRPLHYQAAEQSLANRFQAEFKAKGFTGNVDLLSTTDAPIPTLPLLKIDITDWRAKPGELTACAFSATLITPVSTTWLGNFEGVSETLFGTLTPQARSDALRAAATNAVDQVYKDLQARHILPH